jgi:general secretion pathway protein G
MCCETLNERCACWRRGFSLVEIMIVIVIIGLLAGVVTVNVRGYLLKAKQNAARQEIATVMHALDTFYATYNRYPTNEEGLAILTRPGEKLPEPLLSGEPRDPWGHPYQYNSPGANAPYEVICYGVDGREGGEGGDTDITSANLKQ